MTKQNISETRVLLSNDNEKQEIDKNFKEEETNHLVEIDLEPLVHQDFLGVEVSSR